MHTNLHPHTHTFDVQNNTVCVETHNIRRLEHCVNGGTLAYTMSVHGVWSMLCDVTSLVVVQFGKKQLAKVSTKDWK